MSRWRLKDSHFFGCHFVRLRHSSDKVQLIGYRINQLRGLIVHSSKPPDGHMLHTMYLLDPTPPTSRPLVVPLLPASWSTSTGSQSPLETPAEPEVLWQVGRQVRQLVQMYLNAPTLLIWPNWIGQRVGKAKSMKAGKRSKQEGNKLTPGGPFGGQMCLWCFARDRERPLQTGHSLVAAFGKKVGKCFIQCNWLPAAGLYPAHAKIVWKIRRMMWHTCVMWTTSYKIISSIVPNWTN